MVEKFCLRQESGDAYSTEKDVALLFFYKLLEFDNGQCPRKHRFVASAPGIFG